MGSVVQSPITSERIPFRLAGGRNPLILVPVHVNDKGPYEFILDTGASHCLISRALSDLLSVRPETEEEAMGAGGSVKLSFGTVASVAVGSARQLNVSVAVTSELERIATAIESRVDGDLGFSFLKDFSVTIDYQANTLSFTSGLALSNRTSSNWTPFDIAAQDKPLILVQAIVNDQGPFQFAVDTGASRTILSAELAAKLALETIGERPAVGGGGQVNILAGNVKSLAVGDAIAKDHAIGVGEFLSMLSKALQTKLDGIVGYNFLNQFRVRIDYPARILELVPTRAH